MRHVTRVDKSLRSFYITWFVSQRVSVCVAECYSVLQRAAVYCSLLQFVGYFVLHGSRMYIAYKDACVAVCCSVLQCVAVSCTVLQCVKCLQGRTCLIILSIYVGDCLYTSGYPYTAASERERERERKRQTDRKREGERERAHARESAREREREREGPLNVGCIRFLYEFLSRSRCLYLACALALSRACALLHWRVCARTHTRARTLSRPLSRALFRSLSNADSFS